MARVLAIICSLLLAMSLLGCEMAADQKLYMAADALRQGKPQKAVELANELLHADNIQPQDKLRFTVGAYNTRGAAYRALGKYDKALSDFAEVIKLKPDWGGVYAERGLTYDRMGRPELALADLEKADKLGAGDRDQWAGRLTALREKLKAAGQ